MPIRNKPLEDFDQEDGLFRAVLENSLDAIGITDLEDHILYANRACHELFGWDYERREMVGQPASSAWPEEDLPSLTEIIMPQVMAGGWRGDVRQKRKDGTVFDVQATVYPLRDQTGQPMATVVMLRDITERKRFEEALLESEAQFKSFMDLAPSPLQVYDLDGFIIYANEAWAKMWNVPLDQILGRFNILTDPQVAELGHLEMFKKVYAGESVNLPVITFDPAASGNPGRKRWLTGKVFPIKNRAGQVTKIVNTNDDVTDIKEAELERVRLQQDIIEAQQATLKELATPIIPVMDRIIVMPLIGSIDSIRARDITRALLKGIRDYHAQIAILDVTGVSMVDSGIVSHLNKTIQAAQLKGAQVIITGISDVVAESIVDLGIDWGRVKTVNDLQTGLILGLNSLGLKLSRQ
jgi:PAS domain S-box-containing protein